MKTDESSKPLGTVTRPEGSPDLKAVLDHQAALGAAPGGARESSRCGRARKNQAR